MAKKKPAKKKTSPRLHNPQTGERKEMATALEKIQKLQAQIEEAKTEAVEELREKRKEAAAVLADIDKQLAALTGSASKGTRKPRTEGAPRVCSWCGQSGHNQRSCPSKKAGQPQIQATA